MIQKFTHDLIVHQKFKSLPMIQDYQFYTMSLSQYYGCCQYHESLSIP